MVAMSIICFKNNIVAADTSANMGNTVFNDGGKLYKTSKYIIGGVGSTLNVIRFVSSYEHLKNEWDCGRIPSDLDKILVEGENNSFDAFVFYKDKVFLWDTFLTPVPLLEDYFAIGSGGELALGALAAGADPVTAVEVAIRFNRNCNGKVEWVDRRDLN